jgi:ABC-type sugar transport system ATPase subunit
LERISKGFAGGIEAVAGIELSVSDGEIFALVGPSGSGKSTLLRLIAGLETPTGGSVWIGDRSVNGLRPRDRDVAMVSQNPALYPHLSVFDNLAFGLRARGRPRSEIRDRVTRMAARLGLDDVLSRWPRTLSGGQRQRVALGRALVRQPAVFLLDEPFTSLDAPLRAALRAELVELHRQLGTTMVLVTHDQGEAMALGERVAVINRGRIVQIGSPADIYDRPATRFVAQFIGDPPMNILRCLVERTNDSVRLHVDGVAAIDFTVPLGSKGAERLSCRANGFVDMGVRPEHLFIAVTSEPPDSHSCARTFNADVRQIERMGHEAIATVALGANRIKVRLPAQAECVTGTPIPIRVDPSRAVWFEVDSGSALS